MKRFCAFLLAAAAAATATVAQELPALSGAEILRRLDENNLYGTIRYRGTMEIDLGRRVLTKELVAVAQGADRAFVEFVNSEDRGTRYLKIGKDLWMYFPEEQETVKISGHLLKEGLMGSDVSYEDALEAASLAEKYDVSPAGVDTLEGRPCYILELKAKVRNAPYEVQKFWVDGERFVTLKAEMYAKSGKLLKESRALGVERFDSRWFVTELRMEDKLRKGGGTRFAMRELQFDAELPADQFSLRRLGR